MSELLILMPVYNDWDSVDLLLENLDAELAREEVTAEVVAVDDGSQILPPSHFYNQRFRAISRLRVVRLRRNLGHQRAIVIGLCYVHTKSSPDVVVVMDSDGEDDPKDVIRLLRAYKQEGSSGVIFASRKHRSEGLLFTSFYVVYRTLFRLFTGTSIRFGNFCLIPAAMLPRIVVLSETWNHFAAGILKSRTPYRAIPCTRGKRLAGQSQMNFLSLVKHGLSAVAVYGDVIGTRALLLTLTLTVGSIIAMILAIVVRLVTNLAIPGWATYIVGLATILLVQSVTLSMFFVFLVLVGRSARGTIPLRDFHWFILNTTECIDQDVQVFENRVVGTEAPIMLDEPERPD